MERMKCKSSYFHQLEHWRSKWKASNWWRLSVQRTLNCTETIRISFSNSGRHQSTETVRASDRGGLELRLDPLALVVPAETNSDWSLSFSIVLPDVF